MSNPLFPTLETYTRSAEAFSSANHEGTSYLYEGAPLALFLNPSFGFLTYPVIFEGLSSASHTGFSVDANPVNLFLAEFNPLFRVPVVANGWCSAVHTALVYTTLRLRLSSAIDKASSYSYGDSFTTIYSGTYFTLEADIEDVQPIWGNLIFQRSSSTLTYASRLKFPEIEPSRRSFSSLNVAITSTVSQSGVVSKRAWGNKPSKADMRLTFENIADDEAAEILSVYNTANGSATEIYLPDLIFAGMSTSLQSEWKDYLSSAGMRWFFSDADPPSLESAFPGRSTMQVVMVAEQRRAPDELGFNKVVFIGLVPGTATTS